MPHLAGCFVFVLPNVCFHRSRGWGYISHFELDLFSVFPDVCWSSRDVEMMQLAGKWEMFLEVCWTALSEKRISFEEWQYWKRRDIRVIYEDEVSEVKRCMFVKVQTFFFHIYDQQLKVSGCLFEHQKKNAGITWSADVNITGNLNVQVVQMPPGDDLPEEQLDEIIGGNTMTVSAGDLCAKYREWKNRNILGPYKDTHYMLHIWQQILRLWTFEVEIWLRDEN